MLPLRAVLNTALVAAVTMYYCFRAYFARAFDATGDSVIELARAWARRTTRFTGIRVQTELRTALDPRKPYVFMANHTSAADIWALYVALPVPVRMIAKIQLGRVPFLGWAMRAGRFIFIDRKNPQAARRSIAEAERRIAAGASVLLFPEGTRSRTGEMLPFKKGGFHLAMNAGVDIVPVAVRGARGVLPADSFWPKPGLVEVIVGSPIPTRGLDERGRAALVEQVREAIAALQAA